MKEDDDLVTLKELGEYLERNNWHGVYFLCKNGRWKAVLMPVADTTEIKDKTWLHPIGCDDSGDLVQAVGAAWHLVHSQNKLISEASSRLSGRTRMVRVPLDLQAKIVSYLREGPKTEPAPRVYLEEVEPDADPFASTSIIA